MINVLRVSVIAATLGIAVVASAVPHPGDTPAGHEGWYFDKGMESPTQYEPGGAVPDSFTVAKLIEQGQ